MKEAIGQVHGKEYIQGEGAQMLGATAGGSDDWIHKLGINIRNRYLVQSRVLSIFGQGKGCIYDIDYIESSYTIEMRDKGGYGFNPPENEIIPNCEENIEALKVVYNHVT